LRRDSGLILLVADADRQQPPKARQARFYAERSFTGRARKWPAIPFVCLSIPEPSCLISVVAESHFPLFLINPADIRL